jgi:hypothetical protein
MSVTKKIISGNINVNWTVELPIYKPSVRATQNYHTPNPKAVACWCLWWLVDGSTCNLDSIQSLVCIINIPAPIIDNWALIIDNWALSIDKWALIIDNWALIIDNWALIIDNLLKV